MSWRAGTARSLPLLVLLAGPAVALAGVPAGYRDVAVHHGIPDDIFYAVALAESGRPLGRGQPLRPWPWTLNVRGEGHYYPTRQAATRALASLLATGETAVDVGPMQISWRYHREALGPAGQALDPYRNLAAAAAILRGCMAQRGDWWEAVGCYHAPNDRGRAATYRTRVRRLWQRLVTGEGPQ